MARKRQVKQTKQEVNLVATMERFGDEEKCRAYLEHLRWPNGVKCLRCESDKISRLHTRGLFTCDACGYQFSVKVSTILPDSHLPLTEGGLAVYLMSEAKKGVPPFNSSAPSTSPTRPRGISATRYARPSPMPTLHNSSAQWKLTRLSSAAKPEHAQARRERKVQGRGTSGKAMMLAAIQRGRGVRLRLEDRRDRETLDTFIKGEISPDAGRIYTDE